MIRALALLASLALGGACSVPPLSLDGKACPCVESGYVCDTQTNRCLAANDGGGIIDSPIAESCLGAKSETELYQYAGMFDWQHQDATWTGGTEIRQSSAQVMDSYAFKTSAELTAAHDYHIISTMRIIQAGSGSPSLGVVLRAQLSAQDKSRYACTWLSKTHELRIEVTQGGNTTTLGSAAVAANVTIPTPFTMDASVTGSTLACCIRGITSAKIASVSDPAMAVTMGYPGLQTNRMEAAFGSFAVLKPN